MYSFLPHKELRFILPCFSALILPAAYYLSQIVCLPSILRNAGPVSKLTSWIILLSFVASLGLMTLMVNMNKETYPGGKALEYVNQKIVDQRAWYLAVKERQEMKRRMKEEDEGDGQQLQLAARQTLPRNRPPERREHQGHEKDDRRGNRRRHHEHLEDENRLARDALRAEKGQLGRHVEHLAKERERDDGMQAALRRPIAPDDRQPDDQGNDVAGDEHAENEHQRHVLLGQVLPVGIEEDDASAYVMHAAADSNQSHAAQGKRQ